MSQDDQKSKPYTRNAGMKSVKSCRRNFGRPPCFDSIEQYDEWRIFGRISPPEDREMLKLHGYCYDCLPGYKDKMITEGRCEYPEVTFEMKFDQGEYFLVGVKNA